MGIDSPKTKKYIYNRINVAARKEIHFIAKSGAKKTPKVTSVKPLDCCH